MVRNVILAISLFASPQFVFTSENPDQISEKNTIKIQQTAQSGDYSWLSWISNTIVNTNSLAVRLFLVFLLGLLMSLTPCIYPMIPITAGILQTQSSKSIFMSFLLALSYTFGIATTYAILGLFAAFAGQAIGSLMNQPLFIIPLVALLIYLALSMIGLYEMYIPRFLQPRETKVHGGSFISAFTFGAISGIIASPCLSPGLICLLCLVTTLNNWILGFLLLFCFGIGLSVPLLIIGTFSSSLSLLPRAGMWMIEIKKIFGYLMLGMCLYFLGYIIPWHIMIWIIVAFAFSVGQIFLFYAIHAYNRAWKIIYGALWILLTLYSAVMAIKAYRFLKHRHEYREQLSGAWQTDYASGRNKAFESQKLLFVDIGAPYCSICTAIDKTLFSSESVQNAIEKVAVPVKIDGSLSANSEIIKHYKVLGFPTILLIDPKTEQIIKQWGPELYDTSAEQFIQEIENLIR
jgi:thioredoxin:protein disulfide reductase